MARTTPVRPARPIPEGKISVQFIADEKTVENFRRLVAERELNVSSALRLHMAERVNDARSRGELVEDAA